ncbi:hypothetical protein [Microcoleus sp. D2_18a_D3]|uniref:hypothetical protein n=1 Tax=Microcoleus sp. D2_18a_D3 TaxID=3055330 RepID=UPI002FD70B84
MEWIIGIDLHSQRLHWTLPNLRTPEQSPAVERFNAVDELATLAGFGLSGRESTDESNLKRINLTPGRVAQSMLSILVDIGTPAQLPKHRGKSPGWKKGKARTKAPYYPTVKKRVSRRKKSSKLAV